MLPRSAPLGTRAALPDLPQIARAYPPSYETMIDHVLACVSGHANNLIEPVSALLALELTLQVHEQLNQPAR